MLRRSSPEAMSPSLPKCFSPDAQLLTSRLLRDSLRML